MSCMRAIFFVLIFLAAVVNSIKMFIFVPPLNEPFSITSWKETADLIEAIVTILAIIVGGVWGYWLFVKNRQRYPRAEISQSVIHKDLDNEKTLLHVDVIITNIGNVLLEIISLKTKISQILPLPDKIKKTITDGQDPVLEGKTEVDWPLKASREEQFEKSGCEIEPGESQSIQFDFFIDSDVELIEIYSSVVNETKRKLKLVWDNTTIYETIEK